MSPLGLITTTRWHLATVDRGGAAGLWLAAGLSLLTLALGWWSLRREPRRGRVLALSLLHGLAVLAALVLWFQPSLEELSVATTPNHLAVLVDASGSMKFSESDAGATRWHRAIEALERGRPSLDRLRAEGGRIVDFFTVTDRLEPAARDSLVPTRVPDGAGTALTEALAALRERYQGADLAGVVLLSDGIDHGRMGAARTTEALDATLAPVARSLAAPVYTIAVGRAGVRDLAVTRILADEYAFVRTAITVEARLRVLGADAAGWRGRKVPVTLRRDGEIVRTVEVTLDPKEDGEELPVVFSFTPDRVGPSVYEIWAPPLQGECTSENNLRRFVMQVVRDRIRVLQVAGRPSWDERFLRGLLKRDPNVDLISFFILRTPMDIELVPQSELSLIPFPTDELFRDQLRSFDVVFMQNFNYGPYGIGVYLNEIKAYVEQGGGLAMVGGDLAFTSGGWAGTPVAAQLPVELPPAQTDPGALSDSSPFRMALTATGRAHPITALDPEFERNQLAWKALPELHGINRVLRARAGAVVLGTHPVLRDADGAPMPVLAVAEAGKGRTLALTTDSSWRWSLGAPQGSDSPSHAYQRFWDSAIRWLIRDPSLSLVRLETERTRAAPDQPIHLRIATLSPEFQPAPSTEVAVVVEAVASAVDVPGSAPAAARRLTGRSDASGALELELDPLSPGGYRITATATIAGRSNERTIALVVEPDPEELDELEARTDTLERLATATGGRVLTGGIVDGLTLVAPPVARINRVQSTELWSGWAPLFIAASALALYWHLRRRWGYV